MKLLSLLSVSALLGTVIAGPMRLRQAEETKYRLKVTSGGNDTDIDDKFLSTDDEGRFGIFGEENKVREIYSIEAGEKSDRVSLHSGTNKVDEALSLLGWKGNMYLKETTEPADFKVEDQGNGESDPDSYSWNEFTLKGEENSSSPRELLWDNKTDKPGWVAAPAKDGTFYIKFYDGSAYVIQNYIPIRIFLEAVE
ncbi:hypothetical protein NM208_g10057 [Fusarium decemcellulare]|uniref:Uncharacterized protein n=1 Tax=Fusarium decemcellulare TaxID=57161 RepID=A0ACC1RZ90_9HYPO|nr:hypothetical protein NM208_g10057 [Fusarium decemcellulare]